MATKKFVVTSELTKILNFEKKCHLDFFGTEFSSEEFEATLKKYDRKQIKFWQSLGLEPHFLPKASMMPSNDYPGWEIKPSSWFYEKIAEGQIFCKTGDKLKKVTKVELEGISVLIDTRLKPSYDNGRQMYQNDNLLGAIIEDLRRAGKIAKCEYGEQSSRFCISSDEWENAVKTALTRRLDLPVRLERVIEGNVISQLYPYMPRKEDGNTKSWVWYEEYFKTFGSRLRGGHSDLGGLAGLGCDPSSDHWINSSVRPLAVL